MLIKSIRLFGHMYQLMSITCVSPQSENNVLITCMNNEEIGELVHGYGQKSGIRL